MLEKKGAKTQIIKESYLFTCPSITMLLLLFEAICALLEFL